MFIIKKLSRISPEEKTAFYQAKFDYFRTYATWVVILSCIASLSYFVSDCQLFGRFAWETFIPRSFILVPFFVFLIIKDRIKSYKVLVPIMYIILHTIMWCTIWAIYYLPIRQHANEGFIIMHLMFLSVAFCAPLRDSTIWHCLLIVDIVVSNLFNHYESFSLMLTLGIPCLAAICVSNRVMENVYLDQYLTKAELENLLTTDPLTSAYNRKKLSELCYENTTRLKNSENKEIFVLMLDIDFFKNVNDTYGHDVGDSVLKHVVEAIRSCVRQGDCIVRWGGEEFVVILTETTFIGAKSAAERIRATIEKSENFEPRVTVSVGMSKYDGINYQHAISSADSALYTAKTNGRNRVEIFEESRTSVH